jgi:hypothetical protein
MGQEGGRERNNNPLQDQKERERALPPCNLAHLTSDNKGDRKWTRGM